MPTVTNNYLFFLNIITVSSVIITGRQKAVGYMIWKLYVAMRFCKPIMSRKK